MYFYLHHACMDVSVSRFAKRDTVAYFMLQEIPLLNIQGTVAYWCLNVRFTLRICNEIY